MNLARALRLHVKEDGLDGLWPLNRRIEVIATPARPGVGIPLCETRTRQCGVRESMRKPQATGASESRNETLPEHSPGLMHWQKECIS